MDIGEDAVPRQIDDDEVDFVYDLRRKLLLLDRGFAAISRTTARHPATRIPDSTLKTASVASRISRRCQRILAYFYDFDPGWREWRDPDSSEATPERERRHPKEAFEARWREHKRRNVELALEAGTTECLKPRFASVRLDGLRASQYVRQPGDPFILCDEGDHEPRDLGAGFRVGLARYELDFQLSSKDGGKLIEQDEPDRLGCVAVTPRGTADQRWFLYSTQTPPIRGRWEGSKPLVHYEGAQPGDVIHVEAKAALEDGFVEFSGEPLGDPNREKLAEFLARKEGIGRPDADGYVLLVRQTLRIKEKS